MSPAARPSTPLDAAGSGLLARSLEEPALSLPGAERAGDAREQLRRTAETAVVALGSNLGDRAATLRGAVEALRGLAIDGQVRESPVVTSAALTVEGVDPGRPAYLNQVVELSTALGPLQLLRALQAIESRFGRTRTERWGDRTLDLDLVTLGGHNEQGDELTLPHPRAHERDFVLVPWSILDPAAVLPGHGAVADAVAGLPTTITPLAAARDEGRVLRRPLIGWYDPEDVWISLVADRDQHVWRDRGAAASGGISFLGWPAAPDDVLVVDQDGRLVVGGHQQPFAPDGALRALANRMSGRLSTSAAESNSLGWWGWIGYELCLEAVGVEPPPSTGALAVQLFVDRGIEFDHAGRSVELVVLQDAPDASDWLQETKDLIERVRGTRPMMMPAPPTRVAWRHDRDQYLGMIDECQRAIVRGDAYQICLTDSATLDGGDPPNPRDAVMRLRRSSPAPQAGVVRLGNRWLISASPEHFLHVDPRRRASTSPIKGTRRRGANQTEDARLALELAASEKECAENLMIVDLMRNDLSRIAAPGSLKVSRLLEVESYASVHQLVSTVEADLEVDAPTALAALVPPGSMTGAPKRSAVAHLAQLEQGPRGAYSGVWGRCSVDGSADVAVVIRSIDIEGDRVTIGAGGGITAPSVPSEEWEEVLLKARPLLAAVGADLARGTPTE